MSIARDPGRSVHALDMQIVYNCSTGDVFASSAINGTVIDRLAQGRAYYGVAPFANFWSTWGSTALDRAISLDIKLQHGDSSGGGGMVDFSTQSQPATRVFFTTAQTTTYASWTTGVIRGETNPAYYNVKAAKRYLREVVTLTSTAVVSTSTAAPVETYRVVGGLHFQGVDEAPYRNPGGVFSTSTSTST